MERACWQTLFKSQSIHQWSKTGTWLCTIRCSKYYLQSYPACVQLLRRCLGQFRPGTRTRIQKLQNRAARIITFQGYDVRSAQIRKQLNWEELAWRRQRHLSLLMYDTVNGNVPSYLSDLLSNVCENNPYKSMLRNTEYNVVLDHVPKTEYYKGSFSYRGGMLWKRPNLKLSLKENWLVRRQTVDYILLYFIICTYF